MIARLIHEYKVPVNKMVALTGLGRQRLWQIASQYGGPVKYHREWHHGISGYKKGCRCQICVDVRRELARKYYYEKHPPI
jgi:hypothetical protein